ncbi:MAG: amino acid adenylation domain-containing protein [Bacteroidetes bacterium]|nr:amino acid adenylation domain-containing protein [Bacteroidota bacterium]
MTLTQTLQPTGLYPLSSSQSRIWFMENLDKSTTAYNIPLDFKVSGNLNPHLLERSIHHLIERHDALRTIFVDVNGLPSQKVLAELDVPLEILYFEDGTEENKIEFIRKQSLEHAKFKFDIVHGPLCHFRLLVTGNQEYYLLLNFHHLVCDASSVGIFMEELVSVYQSFAEDKPVDLAPLLYHYSDYASSEKQWLKGDEYKQQLEYWKKELSGIPDILKLPADHPRPKIQTYHGAEYHFSIDRGLKEKLGLISQKNGTSQFTPLLAAFAVILSRYSLQDDLVIGVPVAKRNHFELESLIGVLINSLPVRFTFSEETTFTDTVRLTKQKFFAAFENQEVPFERLVEELKVKRNMSSPPVFQTLFNYLTVYQKEIRLPGLLFEMKDGVRDTAQVDLTLTIHDHKTSLDCNFEYNTDLFSKTTIVRLAGHFLSFLQQIPTKEDLPVRTISILTPEESDRMLWDWNQTKADYPFDKCIHHQFEEQVRKTPDSVALVFESDELTYSELNSRANQLAHYLVRRGAREDTFIAICLERSIDLMVGILAIAKTGGTYLPLDPIYPKVRLGLILDDAQPVLMLTQASLIEKLPENKAEIIFVDDKELFRNESAENLAFGNPQKAAYILYTSGSTGKPKGVQVKHNSTLNAVNAITKKLKVTSHDTLMAVTTVAFDVAEMDFYLPLLNGARLVIANQETVHDIELLKSKIESSGATLFLATPVTFKMLILSSWKGKKDLRILSGGEALSRELAGKLLDRCGEVWNGYAPTETTIYSLVQQVNTANTTGDGYVELGRPLDNTLLYVLNSKKVPVPAGIPGELYIGGEGVSVGYLNLPEMTKERFIQDPFGQDPEKRFYKTGDLVKYLPDGTVAFLNRIDFQVKIRGFRIELGEIESVLLQVKGIKENVVIVREDASGEKMLIAYYTLENKSAISHKELRQHLKERLPDYMIPAAFVAMEKFPLTSTLKIDRNALPDPDLNVSRESTVYVGPKTQTEQKLARIWGSVLSQKKIGIHDDFFEIGGHSMIAVSLMLKIEKELNIRLPLASLFERSTIHLLAELIDQDSESIEWRSLVPIRPTGTKKPLFLVHGLGLNVLLYTTIINFLDPEQPVYGLQAKGLNGIDTPLDTLEEIASYYISEIQSIDKEGPYALAGFSLGGRIAYEMARQLEEMGKEISFLGVLDATAEGSVTHQPFLERHLYRINYMMRYVSWNIASFFKEPNETKFSVIRRRWKGLVKRVRGLDIKIDEKEIVSKGKKSELPKYLRKVHGANRRANRNFFIRPYNGTVHLFKAQKQTFYIPEPETYGWDRVARGGVVVHEIPGEHSSTFAPPNDKYFAEILQRTMDESRIGKITNYELRITNEK